MFLRYVKVTPWWSVEMPVKITGLAPRRKKFQLEISFAPFRKEINGDALKKSEAF
jgi:hypothetical protein